MYEYKTAHNTLQYSTLLDFYLPKHCYVCELSFLCMENGKMNLFFFRSVVMGILGGIVVGAAY